MFDVSLDMRVHTTCGMSRANQVYKKNQNENVLKIMFKNQRPKLEPIDP